RQAQPGPQPELEVTAALARRRFRHTVRPYASAARGATVLAVVQEFLNGAREAWPLAVASAREGAPFDGPAGELGGVTAALHAALAEVPDDGFGRRPAGSDDLAAWSGSMTEQL